MSTSVTVVDYGIGNLFSVRRAFEHVGATVTLATTAEGVRRAERLVLPGVGAFASCMGELEGHGLREAVQEFTGTARPMLGLCVGMQMLFESSSEFGNTSGLGLIPGEVVEIPHEAVDGTSHKIPHIGWNRLMEPPGGADWKGTILEGLSPNEAEVYFVHSFTGCPVKSENRLADAEYGGRQISAAVREGSVFGCQFHPEKSGPTGLAIINNFLRLA